MHPTGCLNRQAKNVAQEFKLVSFMAIPTSGVDRVVLVKL